jgi:hypothetical protein
MFKVKHIGVCDAYPGHIRPTPPANVSCFDAQTSLVSKTTLLKFVGIKTLAPAHCNKKISAINGKQTVISNDAFLPVFKSNLSPDQRKVSAALHRKIGKNNYTTITTYHNVI